MQRTVKTTDFKMTDRIADYLDEKLNSLERLVDSSDTTALCRAELERTTKHHQEGRIFRAEFTITTAATTKPLRVESLEESMEAAIDIAKDEAMRRLRKVKGKRFQKLKEGGAKMKGWLRGWRRR